MTKIRKAAVLACSFALGLGTVVTAQLPTAVRPMLVSDGHTRIADPKLDGGGAEATFHLAPAGAQLSARADVYGASGLVKTVWTGALSGTDAPTTVAWDGTDASGNFVDTGDYMLRVGANGGAGPVMNLPVSVVRIGVTEIEFQDSGTADNEWQMVYFKKNTQDGVFFATPAIHEYVNVKSGLEVSDLDLNDGTPRPAVAAHTATDEPVMDGFNYATDRYNYPVAYVAGSATRLEVTLGDGGTSASGAAMPSGYPVAGFDLRLVADFPVGTDFASGPITPGAAIAFDGPPTPRAVGRSQIDVSWRFEYAPSGSGAWSPVLGSSDTSHRLYTLLDAPKFKAGASGTQYVGPWVEVAENFASWGDQIGVDTSTSDGVVETFVKGFFGQNSGIPTAIEGVKYDTTVLGGDGGANHYFSAGSKNMDLSALLNAHAKGQFVNCSDCMGATTTGLSMLGVANIRPIRLGPMTLKAIWGIGSPAYTTTLWGFAHSFSYHHIVTRTNGIDVIDTCMQLDEDGTPGSIPGLPGWNVDRPWDGPDGYNFLSASNDVSKSLEQLPGLF